MRIGRLCSIIFCLLGVQMAYASTPQSMLQISPRMIQQPEYTYLKQFLERRGVLKKSAIPIVIDLSPQGVVSFQRLQKKHRFKLSSHDKNIQNRARTILLFLEMFLENSSMSSAQTQHTLRPISTYKKNTSTRTGHLHHKSLKTHIRRESSQPKTRRIRDKHKAYTNKRIPRKSPALRRPKSFLAPVHAHSKRSFQRTQIIRSKHTAPKVSQKAFVQSEDIDRRSHRIKHSLPTSARKSTPRIQKRMARFRPSQLDTKKPLEPRSNSKLIARARRIVRTKQTASTPRRILSRRSIAPIQPTKRAPKRIAHRSENLTRMNVRLQPKIQTIQYRWELGLSTGAGLDFRRVSSETLFRLTWRFWNSLKLGLSLSYKIGQIENQILTQSLQPGLFFAYTLFDWKKRLHLDVELGGIVLFRRINKVPLERSQIHFGIHTGLRLHYTFAPRWSVFLHVPFIVYPRVPESSENNTFSQLSVSPMLGLNWSF